MNIGKVCTSKNCEWKNKFPYCSEMCLSCVTRVTYTDEEIKQMEKENKKQ